MRFCAFQFLYPLAKFRTGSELKTAGNFLQTNSSLPFIIFRHKFFEGFFNFRFSIPKG